MTDPARTVVDCFKFRSRVGLDVAIAALRDFLASLAPCPAPGRPRGFAERGTPATLDSADMKWTRISIDGQDLSQVRTRAITDYPSGCIVSSGSPDVVVVEEGGALLVEVYPLTAAQLYFDGVLPQDRSVPVHVTVGRRTARRYLIDSLRTRKNRWSQDVIVLRLVPA